MFLAAVGALIILVALILAAPLVAPTGSFIASMKAGLHGAFWFLLKVGLYIYLFMWLRFTFPRYRFDQLMRLGWHFLIPLSIVNVMGIAVALVLHRQFGWSHWTAFSLTTILTLAVAGLLAAADEKQEKAHAIVGEEA
jgi:NADH-quinone oxidoreductase subunit H